MVDAMSRAVSGGEIANWLLIAFLIAYFVYKEWPEFRRRISHGPIKEHEDEQQDKSIESRLDSLENEVKSVNEKLGRDYDRLNRMESQINKTRSAQASMSEELEIIMEALMGALGGLQQLGANGPTHEAMDKLQNYLNRKAHRGVGGEHEQD